MDKSKTNIFLCLIFIMALCRVIEPALITTTQIPTVKVASQTGNWSFVDPKTGTRCLLVQMQIQLRLEYNSSAGMKNITLDVPTEPRQEPSGSCKPKVQQIEVITDLVNFTLVFERDENSFDLIAANFSALVPEGGRVYLNLSNGTLFKTPLDHSYQCRRAQTVLSRQSATVIFSSIHLQAFHNSSSFEFSGQINDCEENFSNFVEIVVGLALLAFITSTLVVYFWIIKCDFDRFYVPLDEEIVQQPQPSVLNAEDGDSSIA